MYILTYVIRNLFCIILKGHLRCADVSSLVMRLERHSNVTFSSCKRKAQAHYCEHALFVIRWSNVNILPFSTSLKLLNRFWQNFIWALLNYPYQVCFLRINPLTKMVTLAFDWLEHFQLLICNCWTDFDKSLQDASTLYSKSFTKVLFFEPIHGQT